MESGMVSADGTAPLTRVQRAVLAAILLAGAGLRAAYLAEVMHEPGFAHPLYDPQYNDYWARALVTGDWTPPEGVNDPEIRTTPHGRPPGYPWFLAAVYCASGLSYLAPRLAQMGLGLLNVLLAFALGRRIFGNTPGLLGAAFVATYWAFPYWEAQLTYPAVVIVLLLCFLLALHGWLGARALRHAFLAGLLLGLFALFRPNGLLVWPLYLAWFAWILRRAGTLRRWWRVAAVFSLGIVLPMIPPMARNWMVADDFVFLSSYGGLNLYVGNHAGASGVEPRIPELEELAGIENWSCFDYPAIVRGLAKKLDRPGLKFSEASAYFADQAMDFVWNHPGAFLRKTVKKAMLFWGPAEITNDTMPAFDKRFSAVLRWLPGFAWVAALFALGTAASLAAWRRLPGARARRLWAATLILVTGYFLSVIPFFVAGRYRVPIIPLLLVIAAHGVVHLAGLARARRHRALACWLLFFAAAVAAAHLNPAGYEPSEATWHFRRGMAFAAAGETESALAAYERAVACKPDSGAFHNNVARTLLRLGRAEEALAAFARGLEADPGFAPLHNSLGHWHYARGNLDLAEAYLRRALELRPRYALAQLNLGLVLAAREDHGRALDAFQKAVEIDPGNADALYNAGRMLFALNRPRDAAARYRDALRANPRFPEAWNNLGYTLLVLGDSAGAEAALLRAVALRPGLALAWLNLGHARVLQERAEDAASAYRAAMRLDPADPAAPFNLGRLAEEAGDRLAAWRHYSESLARDPAFGPVRERLGLTPVPDDASARE